MIRSKARQGARIGVAEQQHGRKPSADSNARLALVLGFSRSVIPGLRGRPAIRYAGPTVTDPAAIPFWRTAWAGLPDPEPAGSVQRCARTESVLGKVHGEPLRLHVPEPTGRPGCHRLFLSAAVAGRLV